MSPPRMLIFYADGSHSSMFPIAEEVALLDAPLKLMLEHLRKEGDNNLYSRLLREVDRVVLAEVLRQTGGNQLRASAIMGIDRKTLRQKLRNLGLAPTKAPADLQKTSPASYVPAVCEGIEGDGAASTMPSN